jgi:IPT/TIG domain/Glucodextranase, domain B
MWPSRIDRSNRTRLGLGRALSLVALAIVAFAAALRTPPVGAAATTLNLFLHGSGAAANPPTLFLNASTPAGSTDVYKDSAGVNFTGGNAWQQIGSWPVTPASIAQGDLSALGALQIWVGLKNSDDQGTSFDVRAEVLKNGAAVASGLSRCVQGVTRNASQAKQVAVVFDPFTTTTFNGSSDSLVLRLSTRIGTNADDTKCVGHSNAVGLRAYFDAVSHPAAFSATFLPTLGAPIITSVSPLAGLAGTDVTVYGQNFDPDAAGDVVTFGTMVAVVRSATATQIDTTVPAGAAAGSAPISVTTRIGATTTNFTVSNPAPVIGYISPDSVSAGIGTPMSVFGSGFVAASQVSIGGSLLIPTAQTSTRLDVQVPASLVATVGTSEVVVINPSPGGGPSNVVLLTVLGVTISDVTPDRGPVGSAVVISGTGFDSSAAGNQVVFNGTPAVVLNATDTTIETTVPAGATTGPISVTATRGTAASDPFTVTSGATLRISVSPVQTLYSQGQPITITTQLVDVNGQNVPGATADLESDPAADSRIGDTFVYQADGLYTITARVDRNGESFTASVQLRVEGRGPTITCSNPLDGGFVNGAPGTALPLRGSVSNVTGVTTFTVNGQPVALGADGGFSTSISTRFGLNFVDVALVDDAGRPARRTCTFLLSDTWAPENSLMSNIVSFKATQAAVDDSNRSGAINSLGDLLYVVANSAGLPNAADAGLRAANPLKPLGCDSQTCTFLGCICWYKTQVTYNGLSIPGPNTVSLTLVDGGLAVHVHVPNPAINLRLSGSVGPVPFDATGWVTVQYIDVNVTYDLTVSAGRPHVSIRPGTVNVQAGAVSTSFAGVDGWIINNVVVPLAQTQLRDAFMNSISSFITNQFTSLLDGVAGGLNVSTLGSSYAVPRLDGAGSLVVNFATGLSSLNTTTSRLLLAMSTKFQTAAAQVRQSPGAPLPSGMVLSDPFVSSPSSVAVAAHVGIFNQVLHALWRGGYFDVALGGGALGGVIPDGVTLTTTAGLPPTASIRPDGRLDVAIGAVQVHVDDPALLASPVDAGVGGRVSCDPSLAGNDLRLQNCTVDELHASTGAALDPATGAELESLLSGVLNTIASRAVNDALPALPIPGFVVPASLGTYGVPAGSVLGLVNPALTEENRHFVLRGGFGIR